MSKHWSSSSLILSLLEKASKLRLLPLGIEPKYHEDYLRHTYLIKAQLLGAFSVQVGNEELPITRNRQKAVLAYLLLNRDRQLDRNQLAYKFWGDTDTALNSLNVIISQLRDAFRKLLPQVEVIQTEGNQYFLNPEVKIWVDAHLLLKNYRSGREFEIFDQQKEALPYYIGGACLYHGHFLENLSLECLNWVYGERDHLQQKWLYMLEYLCERFFAEKSYQFTLEFGERILEMVPHFEAIHLLMVRCHLALGRIDNARKQFQNYQEIMKSLNIPPSRNISDLLAEYMIPA